MEISFFLPCKEGERTGRGALARSCNLSQAFSKPLAAKQGFQGFKNAGL